MGGPRHPALVAALALAAVAYGLVCRATTTVRVDWVRDGVVYGGVTLSSTGSSAATATAPSFGNAPGRARITVLTGAAVAAAGPGATISQTTGARLDVGEVPLEIPVSAGDTVAVLEAADAPRSGHITCDGGCAAPTTPSNIATSQVTVGTTATLIAAARPGRASITVETIGTTPIYLGGAGVTTTTGFLLPGVADSSKVIYFSGALYGIVGSGSQAVTVEEIY